VNKNIILTLIISVLFSYCENLVNNKDNDKIKLKYRVINGWTADTTRLDIYESSDVIKKTGKIKTKFRLAAETNSKLDSLLFYFPNFKKEYNTKSGVYTDINRYLLIYYNESVPDSAKINVPLSSDQIPNELRKIVDLLNSQI